MSRRMDRKTRIMITVGSMVLIAFLCRLISKTREDLFGYVLSFLRSIIYIVLFGAWGYSIKRRIIHPQIRRQMKAVANLMVFWIVNRSVKYHLVMDLDVTRYLWYLYYLPMIVIPLLCLYISRSICRREDYRIPRNLILLYIPATILLGLVMSNDIHEWVFRFTDCYRDIYTYGPGYYLIVAWIAVCFFCAVCTVYVRNRMVDKTKRIISPIAILLCMGIYGVLYSVQVPFVRYYMGDFTIVFCMCLLEFFESLFVQNLIQTNTRYKELFEHSSIPAVIVDQSYIEQVDTAGYREIPLEIMKQSEESPLILKNGIRLSSAPIHGGRVLWEEDISRLLVLRERLESTRVGIEEQNAAELEAYKAERQRRQLEEKNRLYDKLQNETRERAEYISVLLDSLEKTEDPEKEKQILLRISVIGAYIKRRSNLSFLAEDWKEYPSRTLKNCIGQSLDCLTLFGIEADQDFRLKEDITIENTVRLYEAFEEVTEYCLDSLEEVFLVISEKEKRIVMTMRICCGKDLSCFEEKGMAVFREGDEWILTYTRSTGGKTL